MSNHSPFTEAQKDTIATLVKAKEEAPVLDLDEMSWGDSKAFMILADKIQKASNDAGAQVPLFEELETLIGPYIVSIPRSWLVKRAPDPYKASLPGSLNYLKRDRLMDVFSLIMADLTSRDSATGE